jgi:hypothetical protein
MCRFPTTAHRGSTTERKEGPTGRSPAVWRIRGGPSARARRRGGRSRGGLGCVCSPGGWSRLRLAAQLAGGWVEQERADRVRSPAGGARGGGSARWRAELREPRAELRVPRNRSGTSGSQEKWIQKSNVGKEIRFRGGARFLFFYHVASSGASDVRL